MHNEIQVDAYQESLRMQRRHEDNHYKILGVETYVTPDEIKNAYRKLVKSLHPDVGHSLKNASDRRKATERMMHINEAYATLIDDARRAVYDIAIGIRQAVPVVRNFQVAGDEDAELYLQQVYYPARKQVLRILNLYRRQLRKLSADIYDERLASEFEAYVDHYEAELRSSAYAFANNKCPHVLQPAVQMMRHCLVQASDGLEEMRRFCGNFDYNHLTMAENLVNIAQDLCKKSLALLRY